MAKLRVSVKGKSYGAWQHHNRPCNRMSTKRLRRRCTGDSAILVWTCRLNELNGLSNSRNCRGRHLQSEPRDLTARLRAPNAVAGGCGARPHGGCIINRLLTFLGPLLCSCRACYRNVPARFSSVGRAFGLQASWRDCGAFLFALKLLRRTIAVQLSLELLSPIGLTRCLGQISAFPVWMAYAQSPSSWY